MIPSANGSALPDCEPAEGSDPSEEELGSWPSVVDVGEGEIEDAVLEEGIYGHQSSEML